MNVDALLRFQDAQISRRKGAEGSVVLDMSLRITLSGELEEVVKTIRAATENDTVITWAMHEALGAVFGEEEEVLPC